MVTETDVSFLVPVCNVVLKTTKLLMTKVEGMIINGSPDGDKILTDKAGLVSRTRNSVQDHNALLVNLLLQCIDAFECIPEAVMKVYQQHQDSSVLGNKTYTHRQKSESKACKLMREALTDGLVSSIAAMKELLVPQLFEPILSRCLAYSRTILVGVLFEGLSGSLVPANGVGVPNNTKNSNSNDEFQASSTAMTTLLKQIPVLIQTHLNSFSPKHSLVSDVLQQFCTRIVLMAISITSLVRPVSLSSNQRVITDLCALDFSLCAIVQWDWKTYNSSESKDSTALPGKEYMGYKALLTDTLLSKCVVTSVTGDAGKSTLYALPPALDSLLTNQSLWQCRASTVLHHLIAHAPPQLALPFEHMTSKPTATTSASTPTKSNPTAANATVAAQAANQLQKQVINQYLDALLSEVGEQSMWALVQQSLDVLMQRMSANRIEHQETEEKNAACMRNWYELVLVVGGKLISGMHT